MKKLKFAGGLFCIIILCAFLPDILFYLGLIPAIIDKSWLVIIVTGSGLLLKSLLGDIVSGDFSFHKFGFDNCVLSFGGALTAFVLQLTSTIDHFPGLSLSPFGFFDSVNGDIVNSRKVELFIVLLFTIVFTLITANNSRVIKKNEDTLVDLRAFANAFLGLVSLATYLYILILKG